MILVDANILMYAAGTDHPNKAPSTHLLERIAHGELEACVDAEALQEVLHRYRAIGRWDDGLAVFDLARLLFTTVVPVTAEALDLARRLLDEDRTLMARDALHAAIALRETSGVVCSFDRDFDRIPAVVRMVPDARGRPVRGKTTRS